MADDGYIQSIDELAELEASRQCCAVASLGNATTQQPEGERVWRPVVVTAGDLLAAKFPPREKLLAPWLTTQSLAMIYAPRGIGKTHVALGIAHALAVGGEFLGWRALQPVPVLYVDGEMPGADLQARVQRIVASSTAKARPGYFRVMTPDLQPDAIMPNLFRPEGREAVNAALGDARVIIVDNLSCLVRGGKENEGESWQPVQEWALRMRSDGRSVVFIHHAGKGGQQRGTSKREDVLDTVIALKRPADYDASQGARFEVHFEKARALYGQDVTPFEASLETLPDGTQTWAMRTVEDGTDEQVLELCALGMQQAEIARELGVNRSTIMRRLRHLEQEGRYKPKAKKPRTPSPAMIVMNDPAEAYRRAKEGE